MSIWPDTGLENQMMGETNISDARLHILALLNRVRELEADCHLHDAMKEGFATRLVDLEKANRDKVAFWSYCTWRGMRNECPELKQQLRDWLTELGIDPYASETASDKRKVEL